MSSINPAVEARLNFDAFALADDLMLDRFEGLGLFIAGNKLKDEMLEEMGDTQFSCTLNKHLSIALAEGFKVVLLDKFESRPDHLDDNGKPFIESFLVLWNPEGFLMTLESYRSTGRNSAKLYYNLDLNEILKAGNGRASITSSGSFIHDRETVTKDNRWGESTGLWSGDHDAREAFRYTLNKLRSANPLPVWKHAPFLWLLNYGETPSYGGEFEYDHEAITKARIARLPQEVQDAIKGDARYF